MDRHNLTMPIPQFLKLAEDWGMTEQFTKPRKSNPSLRTLTLRIGRKHLVCFPGYCDHYEVEKIDNGNIAVIAVRGEPTQGTPIHFPIFDS